MISNQKTKNFYPQNKERIDAFLDLCDQYSVMYEAAALQWCLRNGVCPVFGSSKVSQLEKNVKAIETSISEEFWKELEKINKE